MENAIDDTVFDGIIPGLEKIAKKRKQELELIEKMAEALEWAKKRLCAHEPYMTLVTNALSAYHQWKGDKK